MKLFYSGLQYNYYNPKRGSSFEHENFYKSLQAMSGVELRYFPFEKILEVGRKKFNEEILEEIKKDRPDVFFVFAFSDEFDKKILEEIKKYTKSVIWFADDSWRFYNYSRYWAPHFSWAVTTYSYMPEMYKRIGQPNVIRSQWAANANVYKPPEALGTGPDVAFIGGWTKPRGNMVAELEKKSVGVYVRGGGWPAGRVSDEEMIRFFGTSKINLGLNPPPGLWNKNTLGRLLFERSLNKFKANFHLLSNLKTFLHRNVPQIKARHFEIPACGGFVMTSVADDLDKFYTPDKEIVIYKHIPDMVDKIRYYLAHDDERQAIAKAGYERTVREHTYEKRFREIFKAIGL
ncbi:MAG: glycosyltransferase [Patescibacteria group bacterium]|nr:glycosyltransferase [Patescibacteria group bacterium]MDE2015265.1 glycosyltransferase [Patescibacteria group bacterium]MDE2227071.1 glycosyltransferase [Patescibacteria group bacterium]